MHAFLFFFYIGICSIDAFPQIRGFRCEARVLHRVPKLSIQLRDGVVYVMAFENFIDMSFRGLEILFCNFHSRKP